MRRLPARTVYYGLEFALAMPTWVVVAVYLVRELHLSPLQLVLMGTAMEATVFLCEIPTGVVADTYGRRRSLSIGLLVTGAAWMLVGVVSAPWAIVALWALWGFGYTFTSGAYEAWITDEVGAENVGPVFLRGAQLGFVGALAGLVLLVGLGTQSLRAAVIAGGAIDVSGALVCLLLMPETGFRRRPRSERVNAFAELRGTAGNAGRFVRAQPLLLILIGIALFTGTASEAFDRLREAHFLRDVGLPSIGSLDPIVWFGLFGVASLVFGFLGVGRLMRRLEHEGTAGIARTLFSLTAVLAVAQFAFALAGNVTLAIVAVLTAMLVRLLAAPLYMTWLNQQITDSTVRATVISMSGQADAIGQAGGGPVLGAIGNVWGIRAALSAGALLLLPALGLYGRAIAHGGREPELEQLPDVARAKPA
jgi:DHA3 family tetracycline resistance protein-like MFS transporter